ncbi:hypothetical protein FA13DRAFT_1647360 [Coprinellus micaceus]|uniref:Arrestin-like N-terminal domain-containing protein n=1 Tax=Coprinellus micaceus TaxID=71717 RepID=A0A4Y7SCI9_COPMI|nr:hypothetical protein FA13DRAFT_1647360 [Coprinellus micaceus]
MRRRAMTESLPSPSEATPRSMMPLAISSHVSTYRASHIELQLYSPSLRVSAQGPIAVFSDHDQLCGRVVLDHQAHHTGKLILSVEGCFLYSGQVASLPSEPTKHVFCRISHTIDVAPPLPTTSGFTFRDVFGMRRAPSSSHLSLKSVSTERSYPFQLSLPQGSKPGEEMPPSFISQTLGGNPMTTTCEISYKFFLTWHPELFAEPPSCLEVPIVIESERDFQSKDAGLGASGDAWVEMPLVTERTLPMKAAIALPTSVSFCRDSSIPYFVVFSTTPRSRSLAREIAADSTIAISLVRQTVIQQPQMTFPLTPPPSPIKEGPSRILRRVAKSNPRLKRKRSAVDEDEFRHKPLPDIPLRTCFQENKTIYSDFLLGFPKRPRHFCEPGAHPSLEAQTSLPDGLLKGKIPLHKDMLPCIDWPGISVKYYLDVSVINGIDDLRARIPVKIY